LESVRRLAITSALMTALALASCQDVNTGSAAPGDASGGVLPDPHVALYAPQGTQDALLEARLIRHGQCLFVEGRDGTTYGVAWPSDRTDWDAATSEIVVGESRVAVGDIVSVGGGPLDLTSENVGDPGWGWVEAPRVECLGDRFFFASSVTREGR
jgi:hypothetical protein